MESSPFAYVSTELQALAEAKNYYRWVIRQFAPFVGKRVIEVGAGMGTFAHSLLTHVPVTELVLVEPSTNLLPLLQQRFVGDSRVKIVPEEVAVESRPYTQDRLGPLVGGDLRMREIFTLIEEVAPTPVTVVIEGETGTGKELVAQAIHERSLRSKGKLVVFDCTNQPKDLIESALFGHVKGAFTGATAERLGRTQYAAHRTLLSIHVHGRHAVVPARQRY